MSLALSRTFAPTPYDDPALATLVAMLQYKRPHGSKNERKWINRFIRPSADWQADDYGNLHVVIGDAAPRVMFCAHTDTVHRTAGKQSVAIKGDWLQLATREPKKECLGADDGVGVWLLLQMIAAGVPGLYVMFRNEERGRIGSEHMLATSPHVFDGIEIAVAFDRRGQTEVITEQMCGRCASDEFAQAVADALDLGQHPSDRGVYTDTATFADVIPECTNIAAGYESEHSASERVHLPYLFALRDAVIAADWNSLPVVRDPAADRERAASAWYARDWMPGRADDWRPARGADDWYSARDDSLIDLVRDNPVLVAEILEQYGLTARELRREINELGDWH